MESQRRAAGCCQPSAPSRRRTAGSMGYIQHFRPFREGNSLSEGMTLLTAEMEKGEGTKVSHARALGDTSRTHGTPHKSRRPRDELDDLLVAIETGLRLF